MRECDSPASVSARGLASLRGEHFLIGIRSPLERARESQQWGAASHGAPFAGRSLARARGSPLPRHTAGGLAGVYREQHVKF